MNFTSAERRSMTSVWAHEVVQGDLLCETLYRYCPERCVEPVYREEGLVSQVTHEKDRGEVVLVWHTPYGQTKSARVASWQGVMVVR